MLYFAFGSNLNVSQMRARCPGAIPRQRATLPNHALRFGGWSNRWDGAVATVERKPGAETPGLLFELSDGDLEALDRIEGCPGFYERVVRQVVDEHGKRRRAFVYQLTTPSRGEPSSDYLNAIRRAYQALGFDEASLLRGAFGEAPRRIFVYGSLKAGLHNHHRLRGARFVGNARTEPAFTMYSLGSFPGVVSIGNTSIEGEVYEVDAETLAGLDELEGHPRFYRRTALTLADGQRVETYLLDEVQVEGRPAVIRGKWCSSV